MKQPLLIIAFVALFSLVSNAQALPSTWDNFNRPQYSISYPKTWKLDTSGRANSDVFIFATKDSEADKFSENINVMKESVEGSGLDFDQYLEVNQKNFSESMPDAKLVSSEKRTKNGKPYQKLVWDFKYNAFELQTTQYYFMDKEMVYVVTFSCEKDKMTTYWPTSEKIMNSFQLK